MVPTGSLLPDTGECVVRRASAVRRQYRSGRPPRIGFVAALAELVADDHPLDLGGALPDAVDPELAPQAFDGVLAHVAAAPVDLEGGVGHAARRLRTHELDGRRERMELLAIGAA